MAKLILLVEFVLLTVLCVNGEVPEYLPRCDITSPSFDKCVLKAIETVRPLIGAGIPELHIPALNPLVIPEMVLRKTSSGQNYECKFYNVTVDNLMKFKFTGLKTNITDKQFVYHVEGEFDDVPLKSSYHLGGVILSIPVNGKGYFDGAMKNLGFSVTTVHSIVKRNEKRYLKIKSIKTDLKFSTNNILNFGNLIQGNPALSKVAAQFFKDNSDLVLEEAKAPITDAISEIIQGISQKVYKANSFQDIFGVQ